MLNKKRALKILLVYFGGFCILFNVIGILRMRFNDVINDNHVTPMTSWREYGKRMNLNVIDIMSMVSVQISV